MATRATNRPDKAAQFHDQLFYVLTEDDDLRLKMLFDAMMAVQMLCAPAEGHEVPFDHHAASPLFWHFADAGRRIVEGCRLYGDGAVTGR